MPAVSEVARHRAGVVYAVTAFLMWGLFPLYWKPLADVPALEVVAHRTVWALASVAIWVTLQRRWAEVRAVVGRPRTLLALAGSATLIAVNWSLYIWAVTHDHVVEASLGYYINPLVNVLLGVAVLRERLVRLQQLAVALAGCGVVVLTVSYGRLPWVAICLAVTFALYGLVRKTVAAEALVGLLWETALLAPVAAGMLGLAAASGSGALGHRGTLVDALLLLAGVVTAVPLVLFAEGARRLPLSTVGLVQYLSPTCQFLLAVVVFHEPFTTVHAVAFSCIWVALGLLTWDLRARLTVPPLDAAGHPTLAELEATEARLDRTAPPLEPAP